MTRWLDVSDVHPLPLPSTGCATEQVHVFDTKSVQAVNAALAARRPLLVRGEPGTGKSQLARAAATAMKRPYLSQVVDSRTSAQDLLWTFDAVARLAEAQLIGALGNREEALIREKLEEKHFVTPGPLWWALNWSKAEEHVKTHPGSAPEAPAGWDRNEGPVVLIDEIDKADSDVPNGLLDVLGSGRFRPRGYTEELCTSCKEHPLVIITTNEERALPDAFLRRCLVLQLELPTDNVELVELLVHRGHAHFPRSSESVRRAAAVQLVKDRSELKARRLPAPGQAEYLDLVRAVTELKKDNEVAQLALLGEISHYALQKHPRDPAR